MVNRLIFFHHLFMQISLPNCQSFISLQECIKRLSFISIIKYSRFYVWLCYLLNYQLLYCRDGASGELGGCSPSKNFAGPHRHMTIHAQSVSPPRNYFLAPSLLYCRTIILRSLALEQSSSTLLVPNISKIMENLSK